VVAPVGIHESWLLSLWVKRDPAGMSVGELVDNILERVSDQARRFEE